MEGVGEHTVSGRIAVETKAGKEWKRFRDFKYSVGSQVLQLQLPILLYFIEVGRIELKFLLLDMTHLQ